MQAGQTGVQTTTQRHVQKARRRVERFAESGVMQNTILS